MQTGNLTQEDIDMLNEEEEKLIAQRLKMQERKYIDFFNKPALALIKKSNFFF
jgi:hypothetical protein